VHGQAKGLSYKAEESSRHAKKHNFSNTLWTGAGESHWLDWLRKTTKQLRDIRRFHDFSKQIAREGFEYAVVLGMGGSSLAPEAPAGVDASLQAIARTLRSRLECLNKEVVA
jgi:glucose-6-phosphate isomerase